MDLTDDQTRAPVAAPPPAAPAWHAVLRALREARGVTQDGWAGLLGYSTPTIKRWERGVAVPTADAERLLIDLCRERGLFRAYTSGPLSGVDLTPESLAALLSGARAGRVPSPLSEPAESAPIHPFSSEPSPVTSAPAPAFEVAPLPVPPTSFIGREREVTAALLLLAGGARLLTLTGPGGAGKTRLALALAERIRQGDTLRFPDGVHFIDLSALADPGLVAGTIAQALGVPDRQGQPAIATLTSHLQDQRVLLVLDNFEQVVAAAPLLRDLLAACPALTLLVTSRVLLRLQGEREYAVPPLPLPDETQRADLTLLAAVPSVALFVQRAQAAQLSFALTADNADAIAEICTRLDGLPLAIELAAARVRLLSPAALLTRLDRRLPLLTGGARDLPRRQQTLRDTIAWSYDLLSPPEQRLFRCLGAFAGGCTLAPVTRVVAAVRAAHPAHEAPDGDQDDDEVAVLDRTGTLVEHSLLRAEEGPDGEPRFHMLMTLREYALEQLAATGEAQAARDAHAREYLALADEAEPLYRLPGGQAWIERIDREHDNYRAALDWLVQAGDVETALNLAGALWWFWWTRSYLREGRDQFRRVVAMPGGSDAARARALEGAGMLYAIAGDHPAGVRSLEESAALRRRTGDEQSVLSTLSFLGIALIWTDIDRAHTLLTEVLAARRALGDGTGIFQSLVHLGMIAVALQDEELAERTWAEVVATKPPIADSYGLALGHMLHAWWATRRDDLEAVRHWLRAGMTYLRQYHFVGHVFLSSAVLLRRAGREADAVRLIASAEEDERRVGESKISASGYDPFRDAQLDALRAAMGESAFVAAWAEGEALKVPAGFDLVMEALDLPTRNDVPVS